jgi:hypothetical protein
MRKKLAAAAIALAFIQALACSSSDESSPNEGSGAGGTGGAEATGGVAASGASTGESSGGQNAGGQATGGQATGGQATGGQGGDGTSVLLPPENAGLDYQLGGAYAPPTGVGIVSRDRTEVPAPGLYNICYVNGFQIQPGEESLWEAEHSDLILRDDQGEPVIDADWDEMLIDVGTDEKRAGVLDVMKPWILGCKNDGYDAVEIDNLDSFSRSNDLLDENDAVLMMQAFAEVAHEAGLAVAQKNSAELVSRKGEMGTDFVVAEECNAWDECDVYTAAYGNHVLVIEYDDANFDKGCAEYPELSIVLRDLALVTPGSGTYVYDGC